MKRIVLILGLSVLGVFGNSQNYWQRADLKGKEVKDLYAMRNDVVGLYGVDLKSLRQQLKSAPLIHSGAEGIQVTLPTASGKFEKFLVFNDPIMSENMQNQYGLGSYIGFGVDDKSKYLRFSTSEQSIETMIIDGTGKTQFIDPYTKDNSVFFIHYKTPRTDKFECGTPEPHFEGLGNAISSVNDIQSSDLNYRTYRLALSCTGEYGAYFGGVSGALAAMNTTMTRVNGIYEKDIATKLIIIDNNASIIYTNADTDPYSAATAGMSSDTTYTYNDKWNIELQNNLTSVIGDANYDIGHLFGKSGGGGNAGCVGCVCDAVSTGTYGSYTYMSAKGMGYTSPGNGLPSGDSFDIDYVAHEMGHQLGGNHTFAHVYEGSGAQMEPGSGSTIMGYAGITSYNVQSHSDAYFHWKSISQIQTTENSKSCGTSTTISSNSIPVINVGANSLTIPYGTAFYLDATGTTDADGDPLTYCWEQTNSITSSGTIVTAVSPTKTVGPNFRSKSPVSDTRRYFPAFSTVLAGSVSSPSTWETVSNVARNLSFAVTVRDNHVGYPQTNSKNKTVVVSGSVGPFTVTAPTQGQSVTSGGTLNVAWNVAGTNGSPVNTSNVKISLVLDGGATIQPLVESTPNDGAETVSLPTGVYSSDAYIMVESVGNVFYAVSPSFLLGYAWQTVCNTYNSTGAVSIPDGLNATGSSPGNWASLPIVVPSTQVGTVTSISLSVNVTHPMVGDLALTLQSPIPTTTTLMFKQCSTNANIQTTFDDNGTALTCSSPVSGTYKPYGAMSTFNNSNPVGTWNVRARDYVLTNVGTINSASLTICSAGYGQLSLVDIKPVDDASFVIYPNPSEGVYQVKVKDSTDSKKILVTVYDMAGALVYQSTESSSDFTVDITGKAAGIYMAAFEVNGQKITKKLIKK